MLVDNWDVLADMYAEKFCMQAEHLKKMLPTLGKNWMEVGMRISGLPKWKAIELLIWGDKEGTNA